MHSKIKIFGYAFFTIALLVVTTIVTISIRHRQHIYYECEQIKSIKVSIPLDSLKKLSPQRVFSKNKSHYINRYKFIIYHDSSQCSNCELKKMANWNGIIAKTEKSDISMDYYFIFSPQKEDEKIFIKNYMDSRLLYPIYIDEKGIFPKINPFINKNIEYHCFVLNQNNRIIFIGNPTKNIESENKFINFLERLNSSG